MQKLTVREQEIISLLEQGRDTKSHHTGTVHLLKNISQSYFPHQQEAWSTWRY